MSRALPEFQILLSVVAGPFPDAEGNTAFFDKQKPVKTSARAALDLKRDFLTAVASLARAVKLHKPSLVVADG